MAAVLRQPAVARLLTGAVRPFSTTRPKLKRMNIGQTTHDRWGRRKTKSAVLRNLVEDLDHVSLGETKGAQFDFSVIKDGKISEEYLADQFIRQHIYSAKIDIGSIYQNIPDAVPTLQGKEPKEGKFIWDRQAARKALPEPEVVAAEQDTKGQTTDQVEEAHCTQVAVQEFPQSPQAANTNLLTFLQQRDIYRRGKVLDVPDFCVGSIVAVTRADKNLPRGSGRFVGIVTEMDPFQNRTAAMFTLRNVILDEPMEINIHKYSPLLQKIEVLRHQTWKGHETDLTMLRDYPPRFSTFAEDMPVEPQYTADYPFSYAPSESDRDDLKAWFDADFERRRRPGAPYMRREDNHPWGKLKTHKRKYRNINEREFP